MGEGSYIRTKSLLDRYLHKRAIMAAGGSYLTCVLSWSPPKCVTPAANEGTLTWIRGDEEVLDEKERSKGRGVDAIPELTCSDQGL